MKCPECLRWDGHWPACDRAPVPPPPEPFVLTGFAKSTEYHAGGRWDPGTLDVTVRFSFFGKGRDYARAARAAEDAMAAGALVELRVVPR